MPDPYYSYRLLRRFTPAGAGAALLGALAAWSATAAPVTAQPQSRGDDRGCLRCYTIEIPLQRLESFVEGLEHPAGLGILLRLPAPNSVGAAAAAVEGLRARGISPGIALSETWLGDPGVLIVASRVDRIVVRLRRPRADETGERRLFALRQQLTSVRAAAPHVALGIDPPDEPAWPLVLDGIRGYADFLVLAKGDAGASRPGTLLAVWRRVTPGVSSPQPLFDPSSSARSEHTLLSWPEEASEQAALKAFVVGLAARHKEGEGFSSDVDVIGQRTLTIEEIIARHQAAAARQATALRTLVASGRSVLTFEIPGSAAPYSVTADTVLYTGGGITEMEQTSIRVNGAAIDNPSSGVPRLPLLSPERVSTPPLVIALSDRYAYRLEGIERAESQSCYLVSFAPTYRDHTLARGRAWIAADSFALVRLETTQGNLTGPIVSSTTRDTFRSLAGADDTPVWVPVRSESWQIYEGPGHRTPIHRLMVFERHELNPDDFAARRREAHRSTAVIITETAEGARYLRRPERDEATLRSAAQPSDRIRTLVAGAVFDPNISRPLPFAGLSYLDLDFLGTGTEVHGFFGGVYGQVAWTTRQVGRSGWRVFGDAFGILADYHDRSFRDGVEQYDENVLQRPARVSLGGFRSLTNRSRVRLSYELDYTRLGPAESTARSFTVPRSPVVDGLRATVEAERGPWTAAVWWNPARRRDWDGWGWSVCPPEFERSRCDGSPRQQRDFQRFGVSLARPVVLSQRLVGRVETVWAGGHDLDRFSRYAVDGFSNRLRGYPTASVRYDRGLLARTAIAWQTPVGGRLDGFLDAALVHDPGHGPGLRGLLGFGAGIEFPLPGGTLAGIEWGYGVHARTREGGQGTQVFRVVGQKVF